MGFLGIGLTFLGYLLTYAAVANHGRFAVQPWAALFADAYDSTASGTTPTPTPTPPGSHGAPGASPPTIRGRGTGGRTLPVPPGTSGRFVPVPPPQQGN